MNKLESATLAGGCFWCTEAIFRNLKGIISVVPGYSGGEIKNPSYDQVSLGKTGHAEAVQIKFDSNVITFEKILHIFFSTHDPTTKDMQGNDIGPQYRSVIFYHNSKQKQVAETLKKNFNKNNIFKKPIVTDIVPFRNFYKAEDYHINYFEKHKDAPYCQFIINPKLEKMKKRYEDWLK